MVIAASTFRDKLFDNKAVLVTGGTSGIGLAICRGFAAAGAHVTGLGTSVAKIDHARQDSQNVGITFDLLDVRDRGEVDRYFTTTKQLDVLVNAAGIVKPDAEFEEAVFVDVMDVNLNGVMRMSMAALPHLASTKGSVINIASMLSFVADDTVPAYCASKTGVVGLTRALATTFGKSGVRVNALAPGYFKTDMTRNTAENPESSARVIRHTTLKRWGENDELVGCALFLSSPAASYVTGVTMPVDGGYLLNGH